MGKGTITVYHGGTEQLMHPLVGIGRDNLDFGKGFYTTRRKEQAESWARRAGTLRHTQPIVNEYTLDEEVILKYRYKIFPEYNEEWLDFIVANRSGKNLAKDYDIIEGGVANDRVIDSIEAYMADLMPKDLCLKRLSEHRPNNQICILNQELCDKGLHFVNSKKL